MGKFLWSKFFAKIHHNYNHYITIEIFCDRIFVILNIRKKNRKNISPQMNSSLQYYNCYFEVTNISIYVPYSPLFSREYSM